MRNQNYRKTYTPARETVTTTYRETGTIISQFGNVCRVEIGCVIRYIHASKVFRPNGKSLMKHPARQSANGQE